MHKLITELLEIIADGGFDQDDILAMSTEVSNAHANPAEYLEQNPSTNYPADCKMPVWEWVLLEQLSDGLTFRSSKIDAIYAQIVDAFGDDELDLMPEQLAEIDSLAAIKLIQEELSPHYTLLNFSDSLNEEMQVILVRSHHLPRFLALCQELGIQATPSYSANEEPTRK